MTMHEKVSGVWKEIPEAYVNVSGTWKKITEGYENVSGTWKQFFSSFTVSLTDETISHFAFDPSPASGLLAVESDGELRKSQGDSSTSLVPEWGDPQSAGVGDDYEVRLTKTSGTDPVTGPTLGVNHSLSSPRSWSWNQDTIGSQSFEGTLEIYEAGGGAAIASCTITVSLQVQSGS